MSLARCRLTVVLIVLALSPLAASALTVVVNGQTLPSYPPAITVAGRTLLPMRMVFEALGAQVYWDNTTQTAIGTRGSVTVRMTINSQTAYINDRASTLDVPAQLVNGSTYVPLRFPAEAFGAEVAWNESSQTAMITLGQAPGPLPPPAPLPLPTPLPPLPPLPEPLPLPPPAPTPQPGTITGVISGSDAGRVVLSVNDSLQIYPVLNNTIILRQGQQVPATALQPGDLAEVQYDAQGNATIVRATYDVIEGRVAARVPNQILLEGRSDVFGVEPQAGVSIFGTNQAAQWSDINNGDTVVLRVTPGSNRVWSIGIRRSAQLPPPLPPPVETRPMIQRFYSDATGPLRAGQTLRVTLEGTPGGNASFTVGNVRRGLSLRETGNRRGRYQLDWVIPGDLNVLGVPLIGHLTVNGVEADPAQSIETVTLDTIPPVVTVYGPDRDRQTTLGQPSLSVRLSDEYGSGVDFPHSVFALVSRGNNLQVARHRQGQIVTLDFGRLPLGLGTLVVDAYDLAGNLTHAEWPFTVVTPNGPAAQQLSATHDAAGRVLGTGDVLTVARDGPPNGQATFSLGQWRQNLPMTELQGQPGLYRGVFTVPNLSADRLETVTVRLRTAQGQVQNATLTPQVAFARERDLTPVLVRPTQNAHVGQTVVVEGSTQPFAQVDCTITWRGVLLGLFQATGQVTQARLTADEQGHFQTHPLSLEIESLGATSNLTYVLKCTATAGGRTSDTVTVTFAR